MYFQYVLRKKKVSKLRGLNVLQKTLFYFRHVFPDMRYNKIKQKIKYKTLNPQAIKSDNQLTHHAITRKHEL